MSSIKFSLILAAKDLPTPPDPQGQHTPRTYGNGGGPPAPDAEFARQTLYIFAPSWQSDTLFLI